MPLKFEILPILIAHLTRKSLFLKNVTGITGTEGKQRRAPDGLGSVDDLFDPGHTQGDVHGGHACEVESLQGHLSAWLTNALGTECAHCRTRLHLCPRRKRYR